MVLFEHRKTSKKYFPDLENCKCFTSYFVSSYFVYSTFCDFIKGELKNIFGSLTQFYGQECIMKSGLPEVHDYDV